MARTISGFYGAAVALPAVSDVPPSAPPLSAAGPGKMVERRVGHRKLLTPAVLTGGETAQERALVFYAAKVILESKCRGIDYDICIRALGTIMGMDYIAGRYMADFTSEYERQLEDPSRFTIISFHNRSGAVDLDTCTNPNTHILKPTGTDVTATAADARRPSHIKFVTYDVAFIFTNLFLGSVGGGPKTLNITTVPMLPQSTLQVLHDDRGCWKYPQWIQSYVSAPALTSATASTSTSRTTGTTVRYIPDGQSTDCSLYQPLPAKL